MHIDPAAILQRIYETDQDKYCPQLGDEPVMGPPLVGVADADDPLFERLRQVIGPFHWTPQEALASEFPEHRARSVISWSMPIAKVAREANRREDRFPSVEWALVRHNSTSFIERMGAILVAALEKLGFAAVAPEQSPRFRVEMREGLGPAGQWSQRHVAFVAGLGTFGISGGLITPHGIAHRLDSIVTEAVIPPKKRSYGDDPFAWCLREAKGTCGACIARCPVASVGQDAASRDKDACRNHGRAVHEHMSKLLDFEGSFGCGLCQTGVPCETVCPDTAVRK